MKAREYQKQAMRTNDGMVTCNGRSAKLSS